MVLFFFFNLENNIIQYYELNYRLHSGFISFSTNVLSLFHNLLVVKDTTLHLDRIHIYLLVPRIVLDICLLQEQTEEN